MHRGRAARAIPGGRLAIHGDGGSLPDRAAGEIVYTGPNVMLGYATSRQDLALGDTTGGVLHTGDLGYLDQGFLYLTGRSKRIAKVVGLRLSLDDVERLFDHAGMVTAIDGGEQGILLYTEDDPQKVERARYPVASELGIPASLLVVRHLRELPRTPTGKIDYRALAERGARRDP
jgi:acyl-CoA synthetase (AMP-forming)/AMP-acid ligase II